MDQQAKELQHNVPNGNVARMGEGMDVTFASAVLFNDDSDVLTETSSFRAFQTGAEARWETRPDVSRQSVELIDSYGLGTS